MAKTDNEGFSLTEIPYPSLVRVGKVFIEGRKYGKFNWREGINTKEHKLFQIERCNHAIKHLLIYAHYLETGEYLGEYVEKTNPNVVYHEDDLAKVAWFCLIQMEIERLEKEQA